jgi:hypothetical protein
MIFETKEKDLILKVDRILEVEKKTEEGVENIEDGKVKRIKIHTLKILTLDTQRSISYKTKEDRDSDYENLKGVINNFNKLEEKINELGKLL